MVARLKQKAKERSLLRIYYASQNPLEAALHGDCYFCGLALSEHDSNRYLKPREMRWRNPATGCYLDIRVPVWLEGHHVRFKCLEDREDDYPSDADNVVWVNPVCHREFHAAISAHKESTWRGTQWNSWMFEQMLEPINYGLLYLAEY